MSKNNRRQKEILAVAVSAFIITVMWLVFNWYNTLATSTVTKSLSVQIVPITPEFDQAVFDKLRKRTKIDKHFTFPAVSPTLTAVPTKPLSQPTEAVPIPSGESQPSTTPTNEQ